MFSESLSLAQEGIFFALEKGVSVFYTAIYLRMAFLWISNLSLYKAPDSILKRHFTNGNKFRRWYYADLFINIAFAAKANAPYDITSVMIFIITIPISPKLIFSTIDPI